MFANSTFQDIKFAYEARPKRVLALAGKRKTGKSECAKFFQELSDNSFVEKAFADPLKQMFAEVRNIDVEDLYHNKNKEQYREDIISFSWAMKRDKGLFIFAEEFFNSILGNSLVLCDDIRIIEEMQLLCVFGGVIYKVHADDAVRAKRGWKFTPGVDDEISETELGNLCAYTFHKATGGGVIYNNGNLGVEVLRDELTAILRKHFLRESVEPVNLPESQALNRLIDIEF